MCIQLIIKQKHQEIDTTFLKIKDNELHYLMVVKTKISRFNPSPFQLRCLSQRGNLISNLNITLLSDKNIKISRNSPFFFLSHLSIATWILSYQFCTLIRLEDLKNQSSRLSRCTQLYVNFQLLFFILHWKSQAFCQYCVSPSSYNKVYLCWWSFRNEGKANTGVYNEYDGQHHDLFLS